MSETRPVFTDRRLMARAAAALVLANARYWLSVAPVVRAQLRHWERRAEAIPDQALRALALRNLGEEGFTAEAAAILATPAKGLHRRHAVEAIVALEVMFDYLDGLSELSSNDTLKKRRDVFRPFAEAVGSSIDGNRDGARAGDRGADGGYAEDLCKTVAGALAQLPATAAVIDVARRSAARTIEAQVRAHAAARDGDAELERWAVAEALGTALDWREFAAGAAASVLVVHALIAAAADERTTSTQAEQIDAVYLSISALSAMLDCAIDYESDVLTGQPWLIQHYESREQLAEQIVAVARDAATRARRLPHGAHHVMTLVGVVAYYTSAASAKGPFAHSVTTHVRRQLRPLSRPTAGMMRMWRLVKRTRKPLRRSDASASLRG